MLFDPVFSTILRIRLIVSWLVLRNSSLGEAKKLKKQEDNVEFESSHGLTQIEMDSFRRAKRIVVFFVGFCM